MLKLDHLTVVAPTLAEGVDHVRQCLDLDIEDGRTHPEMGTHNRRLRLGDEVYMEVIAVDPAAPAPSHPRWFGLSHPETVRADWEKGQRLRTWVARADDFASCMRGYGDLLGGQVDVGDGDWFSLFKDGHLPMDGVLPSVIDRAGKTGPAGQMTEFGARLAEFCLEHPRPTEVGAVYDRLRILCGPRIEPGPELRYRAVIQTPNGPRTLT